MDYIPDRLLDAKSVMECTTYSRTDLWRKVKSGKFPAPVKLGEQRIAWRASDIAGFISGLSTVRA